MRTWNLRSSKWLIIDKVESNEELLTAILVGLPAKSVLKFRCISKRWNGIILDPYFLESYSKRTSSEQICNDSGRVGRFLAFIQTECLSHSSVCHLYDVKVLPIVPHKIKNIPLEFETLIGCYNGLVLCRKLTSNYSKHYVVNPLNRTWTELPRSNFPKLRNLGLVCEDNREQLSPSFKVVGIAEKPDEVKELNTMLIDTYSSRTGRWKTSRLVCTEELIWNDYNVFEFCYVSNGVFHWYTRHAFGATRGMVVYDSNADENYVQLIELPANLSRLPKLIRSVGDEVIWIGKSDGNILRFWMLPKDDNNSYKRKTAISKDEWILVHTIDGDSLNLAPLSKSKKRKKSGSNEVEILTMDEIFITLEDLIPGKPLVAVLSVQNKVFFLNLETNLTKLIWKRRCLLQSFRHSITEPVSLSAYASLGSAYK